jgi:hypothetical protein
MSGIIKQEPGVGEKRGPGRPSKAAKAQGSQQGAGDHAKTPNAGLANKASEDAMAQALNLNTAAKRKMLEMSDAAWGVIEALRIKKETIVNLDLPMTEEQRAQHFFKAAIGTLENADKEVLAELDKYYHLKDE